VLFTEQYSNMRIKEESMEMTSDRRMEEENDSGIRG
jgi:hypothetical protein